MQGVHQVIRWTIYGIFPLPKIFLRQRLPIPGILQNVLSIIVFIPPSAVVKGWFLRVVTEGVQNISSNIQDVVSILGLVPPSYLLQFPR